MKEIVILGAGYAGLEALNELQSKGNDIHITLVDRNPYHYEATSLHEVASGMLPKEKISYPIKDVIKESMTTFVQGTVKVIDRDKKQVELEDGKTIRYDYLVVALGFRSESFGIPGVDENALQMVDIDTASHIHDHIIEQMKKYRETQDEDYLKIIVCGAGFTGIELVGSLADARKSYSDVAGCEPSDIKIYSIEAMRRLLPMFSEGLADYGVDILKKLDIHLLTGKFIKEIKPDTVIYEDDSEAKERGELSAKTIIWTTGVSGSQVIGESGFSEKRGRVMVNSDLSAPDDSNIYIVGDVSAVMDPSSQRPYPTTAQIALRMGRCAGKNILASIKEEPTTDFTFTSQGSVASIGNTHALGVIGNGHEVKGYPASVVKKMIVNRSLLETGGIKQLLAKGRFDLYH